MRLAFLERALGHSLDAVRVHFAAEIVEVTPVSTLRPPDHRRAAFRLALADGRVVKLRRLGTAARAERLAALRAVVLEPALTRVLFRHESVLLEEWVEGSPLPSPAGEAVLVEAGSLLGRLHATAAISGEALPRVVPTAPILEDLVSHLVDLEAAGVVSDADARRLLLAARGRDPGHAEVGLCHGDLCGENLLVDARGRLRVVDNEGMAIGPLDGDLARVAYRWGLEAAEWETFLAAYARHRDPRSAREHDGFWRIGTVVRSAHVRTVRLSPPAPAPLAEIHRLLEEAGAGPVAALATNAPAATRSPATDRS